MYWFVGDWTKRVTLTLTSTMSLSSFYGNQNRRNKSRLAQRLDRAEAEVNSNSNPCLRPCAAATARANRNRLTAMASQQVGAFQTQESALLWAEEESLSVFARELDSSGRRCFLSCHPEVMLDIIMARKVQHRHFYEVIPQNRPCKLYLDLEFSLRQNPGADGVAAVKMLIHIICRKLKADFDVKCSLGDFICLDSTTEDKFSHHLILDKPDIVFADNFQLGLFIKDACSKLEDSDRDALSFTKDDRKELMVDAGVYTKNRNFRLFLCSKFGKRARLTLSTVLCKSRTLDADRKTFMDSLVSYFTQAPARLVRVDNTVVTNRSNNHASNCKASKTSMMSSPFPEIDQLILKKVEPGSFRKVSWKSTELSLEYEVQGNRYCHNVGRWHKSNNVKYVVLMNRGIYFQMCHDPDCEELKSDDWKLPVDCQPWLDLFADKDFEDNGENVDGEDDILFRACEEAEKTSADEDERILLAASLEVEEMGGSSKEDEDLLLQACEMSESAAGS